MYCLWDTSHPQTHRRAWELFGDMGSFLLRLPYHWVPQLLVTMNTSSWFCSQNVTVTSLQVASYWRGWHRFSAVLLLVLIFPLFTAKDRQWIFLSPPFFPHASGSFWVTQVQESEKEASPWRLNLGFLGFFGLRFFQEQPEPCGSRWLLSHSVPQLLSPPHSLLTF